MKLRRLGRTNLMVTEIGFGSLRIPNLPVEPSIKIINRALDLGVNFIDTARAYGNSEEKIGEVMKKRRNECYLATKTASRDKKNAELDIDTSLRTLKTDSVDLLQLHDVSSIEDYKKVMGKEGALEAAKSAREKGKVNFIGISSHNLDVLEKAIPTGEFDTVLVVYNFAFQDSAKKVIPYAKQHDLGVLIMKPLSGGVFFKFSSRHSRLSSCHSRESGNPFASCHAELVSVSLANAKNLPFVRDSSVAEFTLNKVNVLPQNDTENINTITPEAAWRLVLENNNISIALCGAGSIEDIELAVKVAENFIPLTKEEKDKYTEIALEHGEKICRNCTYCRDCPQDIDIPSILQLLDQWEFYHYQKYTFSNRYKAFQKNYNDCINCLKCEEKCPFKLPIVERLKKAHEEFRS